MNHKPNIVMITTDHQRADSLFAKYQGIEVTLGLNQLAQNATVFERAYTTAPLCVPARMALATGKYPTANGVICNDLKGETACVHKPIHQYSAEAGCDVGHLGMQHIQVKPGLRERTGLKEYIDQNDYSSYLQEKGGAMPAEAMQQSKTEVTELQRGERRQTKYSNAFVTRWEQPLEWCKDVYFTDKAVEFIRE